MYVIVRLIQKMCKCKVYDKLIYSDGCLVCGGCKNKVHSICGVYIPKSNAIELLCFNCRSSKEKPPTLPAHSFLDVHSTQKKSQKGTNGDTDCTM